MRIQGTMEKIFDIHTHTYPEKIAGRATESLGHFYDFTVDDFIVEDYQYHKSLGKVPVAI